MKTATKIWIIIGAIIVVIGVVLAGLIVYDSNISEHGKIDGRFAFSDNSGTIYFSNHGISRHFDGWDIVCIIRDADSNVVGNWFLEYAGNGIYYIDGYPHTSYLKLYDNNNKIELHLGSDILTLVRIDFTSTRLPTSQPTSQPTKPAYTSVPTQTPTSSSFPLSLTVLEVMKGADADNKALERTSYNPVSKAGEKTYLVKIRLTNTTSKSIWISSLLHLKMYVDGVGYMIPSSLIIMDKYPLPDSATLGHGESVTGWMYYIVPNTETPKLAYIDDDIKSNSVPIN